MQQSVTGDRRVQHAVADGQRGREDGEEEERDLCRLARLQQVLHPLSSPQRRRRLRVVLVPRHELVLGLLVWDQADLGVPRDQRVESKRST